MEEGFEERLALLERRVVANRAAITAVVGALTQTSIGKDVHDMLIQVGRETPDTGDEGLEEIKELFVTLATIAARSE